ncbi:3-dehydroquinate synthase [Thiohalorhabdus denitrificans]|uniref:3-dehydroquinate synthase n=1 Tax=Thiohalorhabdus denitrificans TaxID=381306 RepID=A0A0P9CEL8_9GAMM|nr:3-dehydroquinate synthase [Thiohalorhabdus denitrificans]KPV41380.1 3-dehydroquinate synthase [Thiohalorhabdus denitrificans]SCY25305.1 3-dehydroquinate synthase [Thiohalorhabdus denitrificans]
MKTLTVDLGERSYPIHIGPELLGAGELIAAALPTPRAVIVTNETVGPLYAQRLAEGLEAAGIKVVARTDLPDGEQHKSLATLETVYDRLLESRADRQTAVIALGGGVVGDLAGFAAATYQRGVPFVQVPTTLLAQVDAAVGGKTAVNHPRGKNMIGAFYQPRVVVADMDTLATLPDRELRAGFAEVVKYGLIRDPAFFAYLEEQAPAILGRDPGALTEAVYRSCRNKAEVVAADEREAGQRALLNLGHTFAHAIETGTGYTDWLHGEAVAAGMVMAAETSRRLGFLSENAVTRTRALLERSGLPVAGPAGLSTDRYLEIMGVDKKAAGGRVRYVLLEDIGRAFVTAEVPEATVREAIEACR